MRITALRAEDGASILLPPPASLEIKITCASPARQATLTFEADAPLPPLAEIRVALDDAEGSFFSGAIDEQRFAMGPSGSSLLISARSKGGLLLDNEALPASYLRPDLQAIFLLHAAPYGMSGVRGEGRCPGVYQVSKGQSEWAVLSDFCACVCGWQPRVAGDILEACPPGKGPAHLFSNRRAGGIGFASLQRIRRPYGVLSQVRYRPDRESDYLYTMMQEKNAAALPARRFLNLAQSPAWRGRREAELLLRRSLAGSEELILDAPFSFAGELGDAARAPDDSCAPVRKDWCIWAMRYHWGRSGSGCAITLRPKDHF